jgi:sugar phosphate isomerase/epimerase
LEHTGSLRVDLSFIHTLRDAIDVARQWGVGVCVESTACWVERGVSETIRAGVDTIRLTQVSDFVIGTLEARSRAVPGDGDLPLRWFIGELLNAGYDGMFDLELLGPRIEAEGFPSAIERGVAAVSEILSSLGA